MPTTNDLKQMIENGAWDSTFEKLYGGSEETTKHQRMRYVQALESFEELYGADRNAAVYSAPGRTEIGGNHTDHNHGKVMAGAVNLDVIAVVSKNNDNRIRVKSKGFDEVDCVDLSNLTANEAEAGKSSALIRGVAAGIAERGGKIGGFDAYTTSDVLRGSGLSSSAAFEVVIGKILSGEYNNDAFSAVEIAQIGQYAENVFFGKPSGLMDQTACSVGGAITIDFKDPSVPVVEKVTFDLEKYGYALCITDTKGSHADLTDDYAAVRGEMEAVAAFFGKKVLREVEEAEVLSHVAQIREKLGDRAVLRAMHFYAETRRAGELCDAVREDRFDDFLHKIVTSGHSSFEYNQNAYSVKNVKEQGVPLGLALSQEVLGERGAWRLQGGGFAGTIQAFVPKDLVETYRNTLDGVFGAGSCHVLSIRNFGGVRVDENLGLPE